MDRNESSNRRGEQTKPGRQGSQSGRRRLASGLSLKRHDVRCVLLLLLGGLPLSAAERATSYRYWKPLEETQSAREEMLSFTLDGDIYSATAMGLPDLRIVDQTGTEVPYQLRQDTERKVERVRRGTPSSVVSLKEEGEAIEIHTRLDKDARAAEGLSLVTQLNDFERTVRVAGSQDGQEWTPLGEGVIFDYSRYLDLHNHDVPLKPNACREFRITIENVTDEKETPYYALSRSFRRGSEVQRTEATSVERRPLRMDRISFWYEVEQEQQRKPKMADYPVVDYQRSELAETQETQLSVRTRREPLTGFTLEVANRNFSRSVAVQVPVVRGTKTEWRDVARKTLLKLDFHTLKRSELTIEFPEQREENYRLIVENQDNPPLDITGVRAKGNVYRAVFLHEAGKNYRVFYGEESAKPPRYDVSTVLALLGKDYQPTPLALGAQQANPDFQIRPESWLGRWLNNPIVLSVAVTLMVLVLAWGLFHASQRLERTATEDDVPREKPIQQ